MIRVEKSSREAFLQALAVAYLMAPEDSEAEAVLGVMLDELTTENELPEILAKYRHLTSLSKIELDYDRRLLGMAD